MVATAMSNVRRATFTSPDPLAYARSAVATIGILDYTQGYWPHAFQVIFSMRNVLISVVLFHHGDIEIETCVLFINFTYSYIKFLLSRGLAIVKMMG